MSKLNVVDNLPVSQPPLTPYTQKKKTPPLMCM